MINQFLCILFQTAMGPICGMCLEKMLTTNQEKNSRRKRIAAWTGCYFLMAFVRILFPSVILMFVVDILFFAGAGLILKAGYTDKWWKKWAAALLLFVALCCADIVYSLIVYFASDGRPLTIDFTQSDMAVGSLIVSLIGILLYFCVSEIWCRTVKKGKVLSHFFLFIVFCLSELIPVFLFFAERFHSGGGMTVEYVIVFNALFFSTFALAVILFNQSEKEEIELELHEVRRVSELEQMHYQEIEKRREEMAKIRHDYNNMLSSIQHLLSAGEIRETREMLAELTDRIERTREYPFCGVPIINAVLTEKEQICRQYGIRLHAELLLPEELSISDLDLCSALGNLMDNAIRACRRLAEDAGAACSGPEIRLSCGVVNGYLIVKAVNPTDKAPGGKPEGTGYGLKILADLAKRYNGDFFTEYRDGSFTAQLSCQAHLSE